MKDGKNPRIAINHPSGSHIEINELHGDKDEGIGGNIKMYSSALFNIVSKKMTSIVSLKSMFLAAKDSITNVGDIINSQAKAEFNVECGNKKDTANQLTMKGEFITLRNGDGDNLLEISNTTDNNVMPPVKAGITIKRKDLSIKITDDEIILFSGPDADTSLSFIKITPAQIDINSPIVTIKDIPQVDD
jgi:hypothetical protein